MLNINLQLLVARQIDLHLLGIYPYQYHTKPNQVINNDSTPWLFYCLAP